MSVLFVSIALFYGRSRGYVFSLKASDRASLLFGAQSETAVFASDNKYSSSPKLTLNDVRQISWFTDRPNRETGLWSPKRLVRQWSRMYGTSEPNAIASFSSGEDKRMVAFEMFQPKWNTKTGDLSFSVTPLGKRQKDLITGLDQVNLADITVFIDDANTSQPAWYPYGQNQNFSGADFSGMNLTNAQLDNSNLVNVNFNNTNLSGADLSVAYATGVTGTNANFSNTVLWTTNLNNSNLSNANFSGTAAQGVGFENANLTSVNFTNAYLKQANFIGANLTGAIFAGAQGLGSSQFYGAIWSNTICPNGNLNSGTSPCTGTTPYGTV